MKKDYIFVTHLDKGEQAGCPVCGIMFFDHIHYASDNLRDFEKGYLLDNEPTKKTSK